ncbi:hypothetical protein [Clavibacter capsici]|uniref:hypothetical protein n=1 Tax=Clavibacter capsici TaxID=1874630 RepID=UPI0014283CCA|nr:hypothetical protein [Clavibacter capsici]QIS38607.1 hypothetical protein GW572_04330 [Clavibacter capsici]
MVESLSSSQEGLFDPSSSMTTSGDGLYSTGGMVENPPGSGLFSFITVDASLPVLTAFADAAPCPRVLVSFAGFGPGTAFVTVFRIAGGRTFRVRGAVMAAVAGGFSRFDYEAPFGLELFYRAEMFDASGVSLGFTGAASVTLDVLETWVHNPLDPAGATTIAFRDNALRELTRPSEGQVYYPQGRRVGVVVSGQRRGLSGVVLDLIVDSVAQANRFQVIAGGGYDASMPPVGCFRVGAADRVRVPRPLFASLLEVSEQDMNYVLGGTQITFAVQGDEVAPPAEALIIPLLTRADVDAFYNSRAAVKADNLTRGDVSRRYELAGYAS